MPVTSHIKNSPLFSDLIQDVEELYFSPNHNFEMKYIEINESYGTKDSLGVIFYDANDKGSVLRELKNFSSFKENISSWEINESDWSYSSPLWIQGWGIIKFKMKVQESEAYSRKNKTSNKTSPDLRIDINVAPDLGLTMWGDTEDFSKRASLVATGLSRLCFFGLGNWEKKESNLISSYESNSPKCECGAHKTYGKNVNPFFHARWCRLFVNNR